MLPSKGQLQLVPGVLSQRVRLEGGIGKSGEMEDGERLEDGLRDVAWFCGRLTFYYQSGSMLTLLRSTLGSTQQRRLCEGPFP